MKLIIFSGLPGTGKSKLADHASRELSIPIVAKDWIEAILWQNNIHTAQNSGAIAYDMMTALAKEQLERNLSVILDSVATTQTIRDEWRSLAQKYDAEFVVIECICSDEDLHKNRLGVRKRNIDGWPELTWDNVLEVKSHYVPWEYERLTLDSANDSQENADNLVLYLKS
jgi:predicted kinase